MSEEADNSWLLSKLQICEEQKKDGGSQSMDLNLLKK